MIGAPNVSVFYESVGTVLDQLAQRISDGRLTMNPYAGPDPGGARLATGQRIECQPDALPYHSRDRGITLYPTEGLLSQRIRLASWWQLHAQRGTHFGAIEHVRPYFADTVALGFAYPTITIVHQDNEGTPAAYWYSESPTGVRSVLRVSPSNFNFDGRPSYRSRWWAFVDMTGTGYTPPHTYDSGGIYDTSGWQYDQGGATPFTAARAADVAAMLQEWKGAHSWCGGVVVMWSAPINPAGSPVQDATGWWSLPNGANTWAGLVGLDGRGTRPPSWDWIFDNNAP